MRNRISAQLKWLLVERATLVGDIAELERRQAILSEGLAERHKTRDALDISIQILDDRVRADAAGSIHAHKPQYQRRGQLKAYITNLLRATPQGLSSMTLARMAIAHFGFAIVTAAETRRYRENSIRKLLWSLKEAGLVDCISALEDLAGFVWRWKTDLPTLGDLAERCHLNGN